MSRSLSLDAMTRNHLQEELMKLHQKEKSNRCLYHAQYPGGSLPGNKDPGHGKAGPGIKMDVPNTIPKSVTPHRKAMDRCGICLTKALHQEANKGKIMSYTSSTYLLFLCWQYSVKAVLDEVKSSEDRLSCSLMRLHTIVGAGKTDGAMDAGQLLKPMLARGELHCIGATTLDEYREYIEKMRRSSVVSSR